MMSRLFPSMPDNDLCVKEIAVLRGMTVARLTSAMGVPSLVCAADRGARDAFLERWFVDYAMEWPIVYMHNGNRTMAALFGQLFPSGLQIGAASRHEYDPLREIPLQRFFHELVSREPDGGRHISVQYIKGIATLLLAERFEPTLYRLNRYASRDLASAIRRHENDLDEDAYAMLNRYMGVSEAVADSTLDYLDRLCDACGAEIHTGRMDQGKSIVSALRQGAGVSIDLEKLHNRMAADMIFAQLSIANSMGIDFVIALDVETASDALANYLSDLGTARVGLMLCPNIWVSARNNGWFSESVLSSRALSVFIPDRNQQLCKGLSGFVDTYWRENVTVTQGAHKGKNRRAFTLLPVLAKGKNSGVSVSKTREVLLSANELRELPGNAAVIISNGAPQIVICGLEGI